MRDPESAARAQRAATRLESAWDIAAELAGWNPGELPGQPPASA